MSSLLQCWLMSFSMSDARYKLSCHISMEVSFPLSLTSEGWTKTRKAVHETTSFIHFQMEVFIRRRLEYNSVIPGLGSPERIYEECSTFSKTKTKAGAKRKTKIGRSLFEVARQQAIIFLCPSHSLPRALRSTLPELPAPNFFQFHVFFFLPRPKTLASVWGVLFRGWHRSNCNIISAADAELQSDHPTV